MQGCGNDYIYINCFDMDIALPEKLSIKLSDRHFGVGGDGVVLILRSETADAKMRMFNKNGSEGEMCGNAIRCVAKYLYDNRIVCKERMSIETLAGIRKLDLRVNDGRVSSVMVDMGHAVLEPRSIPVKLEGESVVARAVMIGERCFAITCVSMGNPHAVIFCDDVNEAAVEAIGPLLEKSELFPEGVNVEFVEAVGRNRLKMRVWERGSGETLACGTGACAAAVAAVMNGFCDRGADIEVQLRGGGLVINYTDETVLMAGGCEKVFEGSVEV